MDLRIAYPQVNNATVSDLCRYVETVNPETVEASGIEEVFSVMGRLLVGGYALPGTLRDWIGKVPYPRILLVERIAYTIASNGNFHLARKVEDSIFALVAIKWCNEGPYLAFGNNEPIPLPDHEP
jgi:hypothetical protein